MPRCRAWGRSPRRSRQRLGTCCMRGACPCLLSDLRSHGKAQLVVDRLHLPGLECDLVLALVLACVGEHAGGPPDAQIVAFAALDHGWFSMPKSLASAPSATSSKSSSKRASSTVVAVLEGFSAASMTSPFTRSASGV